jgi:hypothetical protein
MSAARPHAVPGGGSALRQPARPPIPGDDQPPASPVPTQTKPGKLASQLASRPDGSGLPGPPVAERVTRVQLNSKLRLDLLERTRGFTQQHRSTLQAVLEAALEEYMDRRGYTADEHARRTPA